MHDVGNSTYHHRARRRIHHRADDEKYRPEFAELWLVGHLAFTMPSHRCRDFAFYATLTRSDMTPLKRAQSASERAADAPMKKRC